MMTRTITRLLAMGALAVLSALGAKTVNAAISPCSVSCFGGYGSLWNCSACYSGHNDSSCWVVGTGCSGGQCSFDPNSASCHIKKI